MRVIMLRFPHLAEQILQKLDNKGLVKSREVQRSWQKFIDQRDYPWIRIVNIPAILSKGNKYLHLAAEYGQIHAFEMILNEDSDINLKNYLGQTPFLIACSKGRGNIVLLLLKIAEMIFDNSYNLKIDLNTKDEGGATAFHYACLAGHSEIVEMIINISSKLKIELSTGDNSDITAFQMACNNGHIGIVKLMLENSSGLQIDWNRKIFTKTGFQLACLKGHLKIAEMMINKSADLKIDLNTKDQDGHTAFHLACMGGDLEIERSNCTRIVEMLIDQSEYHKIDVTTKDDIG